MTHALTEKNAQAIQLFAVSQIAMGTACLIAVLHGGDPMPLATHGGATAAFTALEWSQAVIFQGVLLWVSARVQWVFGLVASGLFGAAINGALAFYSAPAEAGFIVTRGAVVFAVAHSLIAAIAAVDWIRLAGRQVQVWRHR